MVPTAWIYSIQFEFWPPQLHQHLHPHSTYHLGSRRTYPLLPDLHWHQYPHCTDYRIWATSTNKWPHHFVHVSRTGQKIIQIHTNTCVDIKTDSSPLQPCHPSAQVSTECNLCQLNGSTKMQLINQSKYTCTALSITSKTDIRRLYGRVSGHHATLVVRSFLWSTREAAPTI